MSLYSKYGGRAQDFLLSSYFEQKPNSWSLIGGCSRLWHRVVVPVRQAECKLLNCLQGITGAFWAPGPDLQYWASLSSLMNVVAQLAQCILKTYKTWRTMPGNNLCWVFFHTPSSFRSPFSERSEHQCRAFKPYKTGLSWEVDTSDRISKFW